MIARTRSVSPARQLGLQAAMFLLPVLVFVTLGFSRRDPVEPARGLLGTLLSPVAEAGAALHRQMTLVWVGMFRAPALARENEALRQDLAELRLRQALAAAHAEVDRARAAVTPSLPASVVVVPAAVIGRSPVSGRQMIWIASGAQDGLAAGMVVMGAGGVVGTVERVFETTALVALLSDTRSRWGAVALESGEQGILTGLGRDGAAELLLERSPTSIKPGESVTTSGQAGSAAPGGLPFGTVRGVTHNSSGELVAELDFAEDAAASRVVFVLLEKKMPWVPPTK